MVLLLVSSEASPDDSLALTIFIEFLSGLYYFIYNIMIRSLLLALLCSAPLVVQARTADSLSTRWQQGVRYEIEATLDTLGHHLDCRAFITYTNHAPDTLRRMYWQVPGNAFADDENTAMKEMARVQGPGVRVRRFPNPTLKIEGLQFHRIGGATDIPFQAYKFGDTVLDWPLPVPLLPGDSLTMTIAFSVDCRDLFKNSKPARRALDFVLWFPRLCVYDERGWHAEPFHFMMSAQSVFAEFADFEVRLAVPANYVVVASGALIDGDTGWDLVTVDSSLDSLQFIAWQDSARQRLRARLSGDGFRRLRFRARQAQNFIWSTSPAFVRLSHAATPPVQLFFRDFSGKRWAEKVRREIDPILGYARDHIGEFDHDELVLVQTRHPRPIFQPPMAVLDDDNPFSLMLALARMYIPGTVGIDGVHEGWLSNGLSLYLAKAYSEHRFGRMGYDADAAKKGMGGLVKLYSLPSMDQFFRSAMQLYMNSGRNEAMAKAVYEYSDPLSMVSNSFLKSELVFEMLRFVIGDSAFTGTIRDFYRDNALHHAGAETFIAASEKNSGQKLDWFFDQWLHRTPTVDYKKGEIKKEQLADGSWRTEVNLERNGDGIMPVEVEADLGNGEKITKRWDGRGATGSVVFETPQQPKTVNVDPQNRILDNYPLNNRRPRVEFKPDLPFMQFIHMPSDAYVVLWRPTIGYNDVDGLRLGFRARSSYRAFYNNTTVQLDYGFKSQALDGKVAYDHPLRRNNLLNRYGFLARKNEGRFETDLHVVWRGADGVISAGGRKLQVGVNYTGLLDADYTFRKVKSDTGTTRYQEWDDVKILAGYAEAAAQLGGRRHEGRGTLRLESALPGGERRFTKVMGRAELSYRLAGFTWRGRGNAATAFGPDPLPLQDKFHGEGADARTRFRNDIAKTIEDTFTRQYVDGGGFLRGYAGMPLPVERYATLNLEAGPSGTILGFSLFGFFDRGAVWRDRHGHAVWRGDGGVALAFGGAQSRFLGGSVFSAFSARFYVPFYLSHPLPNEEKYRFRYYFTIGRDL